ncbi:MAG: type 4a pilus biogenesis protein PilO [Halomonas sp.]|uniref:type 4a pilus biogenesis protein PilO n=1 Tax=Halomonas sp. TaxID=1486246 RepID=UPI0017ED0C61|nr:type 4a pilus biogenesis protein PilO [Halomonas sp.]NWN81611.1 type 4a pilus biogenesis protein PilO [Halomonas sp.]
MSLIVEMRRLGELDWRELDVKEAGSWPWSLQLLLCLLVLGVMFFGMHWYLAASAKEQLDQVRAEESRLILDYRSKTAQAASLEAMREQMSVLDASMETLREMLPTGSEVPSLLDSISEAAIDHQLAIDFLRLRSQVEKDHYTERPFDIQVRGDYHRIGAFLADVASMPRIVTLHDLTLTPEENGQRLRLSMQARTYSYRQQGRGES